MSQTPIECIDSVFDLLNAHNIPACIIGEIALNYYNVPRVVHDLEIAVPESDLQRASMLLKSEQKLFAPADETTFNVYTEYRRGLPRFRFQQSATANVVLFPDGPLESGDTVSNIIPQSFHRRNSEYSSELLDLIPGDRISFLPLPFLGPLLSDYCRKYMLSKDDMAAIAVEGLVDGMNLDHSWCLRNLTSLGPTELDYMSSILRKKGARMDDFSPNTVTCIVSNNEERERLLKVPGRELPSCPGNQYN